MTRRCPRSRAEEERVRYFFASKIEIGVCVRWHYSRFFYFLGSSKKTLAASMRRSGTTTTEKKPTSRRVLRFEAALVFLFMWISKRVFSWVFFSFVLLFFIFFLGVLVLHSSSSSFFIIIVFFFHFSTTRPPPPPPPWNQRRRVQKRPRISWNPSEGKESWWS